MRFTHTYGEDIDRYEWDNLQSHKNYYNRTNRCIKLGFSNRCVKLGFLNRCVKLGFLIL